MRLDPPTDLAERRAAKRTPGAQLLDDIEAYCRRFVAYPDDDAVVAHVLWIAHTHAMHRWESTPRLFFESPEPGSGKTRALEVTELLVPRPVLAVNVSPAYLIRKVSDPGGLPTVLHDEIDTVFGWKVKADHEDVRGLLNAGHRRGAFTGRAKMVGKEVKTEELPAYCAVAMAGLDDNLPDTLMTRSIVVHMRRRKLDERVEPFRRREQEEAGHALRDRLAEWAATVPADAFLGLPPEVADRDADKWEALIAMADWAGGEWPEKARVTAVTAVTSKRDQTESLGVRLLMDLRTVFEESGRETMYTTEIVSALMKIEDAPWGRVEKLALDSNALARRLKAYEVESISVRRGKETKKGYKREDLADPWQRYLPSGVPEAVTDVTAVTDLEELALERNAVHLAELREQVGR